MTDASRTRGQRGWRSKDEPEDEGNRKKETGDAADCGYGDAAVHACGSCCGIPGGGTGRKLKTITAFTELDEETAVIHVPLGADETTIQELLTFPQTVEATVVEELHASGSSTGSDWNRTTASNALRASGSDAKLLEDVCICEEVCEESHGNPDCPVCLEDAAECDAYGNQGDGEIFNDLPITEDIPVTWRLDPDPEKSVKAVFDAGQTPEQYFGVDENGYVRYDEASEEKKAAYEDLSGAYYTYVPELPETDADGNPYVLGDGAELPQITVLVGESGMAVMSDETEYGTAIGSSASDGVTATVYTRDDITDGTLVVFSGSGVATYMHLSSCLSAATRNGSELGMITKIKKVIFEDGITGGGNNLFLDAAALTEVVFPASGFQSMGDHFFENCTSLTELALPAGLIKIPASAFSGATALEKVTIPDSVTEIGESAFYSCSSLVDLEFGAASELTTIKDLAFMKCTTFQDTDLFTRCPKLTFIEGASGFDRTAFHGTIVLPPTLTTFESIDLGGKIDVLYLPETAALTYQMAHLMIRYKIQDGKAYITSIAKKNGSSVTSLTLLQDLCGALIVSVAADYRDVVAITCTSHVFADDGCQICGYGNVGTSCHYEYDAATGTLSLLGTGAMTDYADSRLLPWLVREECTAADIRKVIIGDGITHIGAYSFYECTNLKSIKLSDATALTSIGDYAFTGCSSFGDTGIFTKAKLTTIGIQAFNKCSFTGIVILPATLTSLDSMAIGNNFSALFLLPGSVSSYESPGNYLFYSLPESGGAQTTELTLGGLGYYAKLPGVLTLPAAIGGYQVISAPYAAFQEKKLTIKDTEHVIASDGLCHICGYNTRAGAQVEYSLVDGVLTLSGSGATYDFYYSPEQLSEGGTVLAPWYDRKNEIRKVVVGNGITKIGSWAFSYCTNLKELVFAPGSSLEELGKGAFAHCTSLQEVVVPESVIWIDAAFFDCTSSTFFYPETSAYSVNSFSGTRGFASYQVKDGKKLITSPLGSMIRTTDQAYTGTDASGAALAGASIDPADVVVNADSDSEETFGVSIDPEKWVKSVQEASCVDPGTYHIVYTGAWDYADAASGTTRSVAAEFQITKGIGSGTVTLEGWTYGDEDAPKIPSPVSATNGIESVTCFYKQKAEPDSAYQSYDPATAGACPVNAGTYCLKAEFAETENYGKAEAVCEFTIAPKPVTAVITVSDKTYDGTVDAAVSSQTIKTGIDGEKLQLSGVSAQFDTAGVGTDKTVHLDSSQAVVTGEGSTVASNYRVEYPKEMTAAIMQGTGSIAIEAGKEKVSRSFGDPAFSLDGITKTGDGTLTYKVENSRNAAGTTVADTEVITVKSDGTVAINGAGTAEITLSMDATANCSAAVDQTVWVTISSRRLAAVAAEVTAPQGNKVPQSILVTAEGSGYTGTIQWTPADEVFAYNQTYTATVIFTPDGNHVLDENTTGMAGWTKVDTQDGTRMLTRVYTTAKAKMTGVAAPQDQTLRAYYTDAASVIATLPSTIAVTVQKTGAGQTETKDMSLMWSCAENYHTAPSAANTFTWSIDPENQYADYDASEVAVSGSITVTNKAATAVVITETNREMIYDGGSYDVSGLFEVDVNAGAKSYEIVAGGGSGVGGDSGAGAGSGVGAGAGTLSGSNLTITRAGDITIRVRTAADGNYAAGEATAVLTVKPGIGRGTVSLENWGYGETAKTAVVTSVTNGTAHVRCLYKKASDPDNAYTAVVPQNAGVYTVKAVFAATGLYAEVEAGDTFTIVKAAAPELVYPAAVGSFYSDQKLSDVALTGGSTEYGSFAWTDGSVSLETGDYAYEVTFLPDEATMQNYEDFKPERLTGLVSVHVSDRTSGGGSGSGSGSGSSSGAGSGTGSGAGWSGDASGNWKYYDSDGTCASNAWRQVSENGVMTWYHFGEDGSMNTGWLRDADGSWYYLNPVSDGTKGAMKTGWFTDPLDGHRYYLDPKTGRMAVGRVQIDGIWYYFNETAPEASGWYFDQIKGQWAYDPKAQKPLGVLV